MVRPVLLLIVLALPAQAAPQLKPRKLAPDPEAVRIEALRAKYYNLRQYGDAEEQREVAEGYELIERMLLRIEKSPTPEVRAGDEAALRRLLGESPVRPDLYDILLYDRDRKKAAGGK